MKAQPRTDTPEYEARRDLAIKRGSLVLGALQDDLFSLDDMREANDAAMGRIDILWLALNGGARVASAVHTRAIVAAIGAARRRVLDEKPQALVTRVRQDVEELAPHALKRVNDEAIAKAIQASDAKSGILGLLKVAKLPATVALVDKYLNPRRR